MARPHAASVVEDAWNRRVSHALRARGWGTKIIPFTGYGSPAAIRVLARVLITRHPERPSGFEASSPTLVRPSRLLSREGEVRGWRAFMGTPPVADEPVTVVLGERRVVTRTDRSGLVDVTVRGHGLPPGWHTVRLESGSAQPAKVPVRVIGTTQRFGVVSDIDDTVISTHLPRPLIAGWNTFVRSESARDPVPGMATLYRRMLEADPQLPFIYLSTGAWNTAPWLARFLRRNGYPPGPMLMTDWGPTNTGWFRSGQDHKRSSLQRLARELPHVRWVLVGDDGQHDPKLYTEFATRRPDHVAAIAIRQLTPSEQVLSHMIPVANDEIVPAPTEDLQVPFVRAPDGFALHQRLRAVVDRLGVARAHSGAG